MKQVLKSPLTSAILGGLVVAVSLIGFGVVGKGKTTTIYQNDPLAAKSSGKSTGSSTREIYKRDAPGVVHIKARLQQKTESPFDPFGGTEQGLATGSGFVLDNEGHIMTNAHVVDSAKSIRVSFSDEKTVTAKVIGKDLGTDLAVLKVDPKGLKLRPLELGNSDAVQVGDPTIAIGNPFGLDRTLTTGVVSAIQRKITAPNGLGIKNVIQTDAAINPGNSGGPLIDSNGRVIGINSQIAVAGGQGNVGIAFAVPIATAKEVIPQLKKNGTVKHAFLGVIGRKIDSDLKPLNLKANTGVLVLKVTRDAPAAKAGLRGGSSLVTINGEPIALGGDIIQSVNGKKVTTMDELINAVNGRKPGDKVSLDVVRSDGKRKRFDVKLGNRPDATPEQ